MQLPERIQRAETHQSRIIFNESLNDQGNLFGGQAMKWMDEVAYITAIRYARMNVVTVSVDKLKFKKAIKSGSIIDIIGQVLKAGKVKLEIKVEIITECSDSAQREIAIEAIFTFAAINCSNKPICLS